MTRATKERKSLLQLTVQGWSVIPNDVTVAKTSCSQPITSSEEESNGPMDASAQLTFLTLT